CSETYSLSLHDALPILVVLSSALAERMLVDAQAGLRVEEMQMIERQVEFHRRAVLQIVAHGRHRSQRLLNALYAHIEVALAAHRSEEHTSELQSRENLV